MSHAVTPEGIEKLRWNERPEKYRDLIRAVNELLEVGSYRNGRTLKVRAGDIIDLLEKWGSRPLPILGSNEFAFEDVYRAAGWKVTQIDGDLGYSSYWEFTPAVPGQKKLRIVKPRRPVAPRELGSLRGERFASEYPEVIDIVNNLLETNPDHDGTVIISTGGRPGTAGGRRVLQGRNPYERYAELHRRVPHDGMERAIRPGGRPTLLGIHSSRRRAGARRFR